MSLLQAALQAHSTVTRESIETELPNLTSECNKLYEITMEYMEDTQIKMNRRPDTKHIHYLQEQANDLVFSLDNVKNKLNDLVKDNSQDIEAKIRTWQNNVKQIDKNLAVCKTMCDEHVELNSAKMDIRNCEYLRAAQTLKKLEETDRALCPKVLEEYFEQVLLARSELCSILLQKLKEKVNISKSEEGIFEKYTLSVNSDSVEEIIKASVIIDSVSYLNSIVKFIWNHVFSNIVLYSTNLNVQMQEKSVQLVVKVNKKHKDDFKMVFMNITVAAQFLHENYNFPQSENVTTIDHLRENIKDNLSELITKFCLQDTIPSNEEDLKEYSDVQNLIKSLQNQLIEYELFDKSMTTLSDHVEDINSRFIAKKCAEYKNKALELMKMDLHDTILIGEPVDSDTKRDSSQFYQCAVSKSVQQFSDLLEVILESAASSQIEASVWKYVSLVSKIIALYDSFTYKHHEKLLKTIPQQLAIFYNNCKCLNHDMRSKRWKILFMALPEAVHSRFQTFISGGARLGAYADELMDNFIREQTDTIKATVKSVEIPKSMDSLNGGTEKAIRQCLRQQELLKTVWQKVLNHYDLNEKLGIMLNALAIQLVDDVMAFRDISADVADQLVEMIKIVLTRGPKLFAEPNVVNLYVKNWDRLSELVFVLNSDLMGIDERWAEGKGPMARYLTEGELKKLVQALFATSDRRAALLAKIKT